MLVRHLDILAAIEWLRNYIDTEAPHLDKDRIGVYGESMGGASVLLAAANDKNQYPVLFPPFSFFSFLSFDYVSIHISAVVSESSYTSAREAFKSWIPAHVGGYVEFFGFDLFKSDAFLNYMWECIVFLFPYPLLLPSFPFSYSSFISIC